MKKHFKNLINKNKISKLVVAMIVVGLINSPINANAKFIKFRNGFQFDYTYKAYDDHYVNPLGPNADKDTEDGWRDPAFYLDTETNKVVIDPRSGNPAVDTAGTVFMGSGEYDPKNRVITQTKLLDGSKYLVPNIDNLLEILGLNKEEYYEKEHAILKGLADEIEASEEKEKLHNLYRLYNKNNGEHFYTTNVGERDKLRNLGWKYEGVAGQILKENGIPVYRVYNPNSGEHHYTKSEKEKNKLVNLGWKDEGIEYQAISPSDERFDSVMPIYRLYNPNSKDAGAHHYTKSEKERDKLIKLGWKDEGVGFTYPHYHEYELTKIPKIYRNVEVPKFKWHSYYRFCQGSDGGYRTCSFCISEHTDEEFEKHMRSFTPDGTLHNGHGGWYSTPVFREIGKENIDVKVFEDGYKCKGCGDVHAK